MTRSSFSPSYPRQEDIQKPMPFCGRRTKACQWNRMYLVVVALASTACITNAFVSKSSSSTPKSVAVCRTLFTEHASPKSLVASTWHGRRNTVMLHGSASNDNGETLEENATSNNSFKDDDDQKSIVESDETNTLFWLPQPLREFGDKAWGFVVQFRWVALSFVGGTMFATSVLFAQIYHEVESLSKPVTLFETILTDLEQSYVDPVDTNKLFETGVSAMLRSLDPYTEYEGPQEAVQLTESIEGKYGGVGLVISGNTQAKPINNNGNDKSEEQLQKTTEQQQAADPLLEDMEQSSPMLAPPTPVDGASSPMDGQPISSSPSSNRNNKAGSERPTPLFLEDEDEEDDLDTDELWERQQEERLQTKAQKQGIRVVNAFENYAFDYGMRVGDKLVAVDEQPITSEMTVEDVRNKLRGEPGTSVSISFEREGVSGIQTITMPRSVVSVRDVKLATLLGDPKDGIGYIQLSGFASDTGREMRNAIRFLQQVSEDASDGSHSLQGLVLDMRGNPGGLLTSAVDVASLLVPKGSDIVSAKGRGFPGVLYRSRVDPVLDPSTKLAVLVNRGTASAAEIVSGAVQDLDVGIIVGSDRTFGKGLVQNVEELPFGTALKFTVAKYYTPSGRCIQGVNYKEGGGLREEDGKYTASKIPKKQRAVFYTKNGRVVRDGGGIEADFKVEAPKASALELVLLRSGVMSDFAADWSRTHELTNNFRVDDDTYRSFQSFVAEKQRVGDMQLEVLYSKSLDELKKTLKASGYKGSEREVEALQASIVRDIQRDFDKYREDIKEDISQSILARYVPERMLIERGVKKDVQVTEAVKLLATENRFDKLLARETTQAASPASASEGEMDAASLRVASSSTDSGHKGAQGKLWRK